MKDLLSSVVGGGGIVLVLRVAPHLENSRMQFAAAALGLAGVVLAIKGRFFKSPMIPGPIISH